MSHADPCRHSVTRRSFHGKLGGITASSSAAEGPLQCEPAAQGFAHTQKGVPEVHEASGRVRRKNRGQSVQFSPCMTQWRMYTPFLRRYTFERPRLRCIIPDSAGDDTRLLLLAETVHDRGPLPPQAPDTCNCNGSGIVADMTL